jgi:hypothetical protein
MCNDHGRISIIVDYRSLFLTLFCSRCLLSLMCRSQLSTMSEAEAKKGEDTTPAPVPAPAESRGPRRGPRGGGEKTCYNCGQVSYMYVLPRIIDQGVANL